MIKVVFYLNLKIKKIRKTVAEINKQYLPHVISLSRADIIFLFTRDIKTLNLVIMILILPVN